MSLKTRLKLEVFSGFHDPNSDIRFLSVFRSAWQQTAATATIKLDISLYSIDDVFRPSFTDRIEPRATDTQTSTEHGQEAMIYLGFSAGCIRAALTANIQHARQESVIGIIAIDGWSIPFVNPLISTDRFSHDYFTHISSEILGGRGLFFADPPVPHLCLWEQPDQVQGWYCLDSTTAIEMNAVMALVLSMLSLAKIR